MDLALNSESNGARSSDANRTLDFQYVRVAASQSNRFEQTGRIHSDFFCPIQMGKMRFGFPRIASASWKDPRGCLVL